MKIRDIHMKADLENGILDLPSIRNVKIRDFIQNNNNENNKSG